MKPIHPGEVLNEDFLAPMGITKYRLAKDINVSASKVGEIVKGTRGITPETALRLARYFGNSPEFWINLQRHYDMEIALDAYGKQIEKEVKQLKTA